MTQLPAAVPGWEGPGTATGCRVLVAGFGIPARRDLDFGTQVVKVLDELPWPRGVVVEDLACSPHLVLHRLKELHPRKLVLVGAVARGAGVPGSVRRRRPEGNGFGACLRTVVVPEVMHQGLLDSVSGAADLDHTLAVLRQWDGLPAETVLIEVEPADCSFGVGFSEELAPCVDRVIELVREELDGDLPALGPEEPVMELARPPVISEELGELIAFAHGRHEARAEERQRRPRPAVVSGVETVWRSQPWSLGLESGSDWHDVFPLDDGLFGVVLGDVPGRGASAVALKTDVRMAVRAYALLEGRCPARLVACLDRFSVSTGRGERTTLVYFTVDAASGELRLCTAGLCPPLVLEPAAARPWFVHDATTAPIGANGASPRHEIETRLAPGSTVLAFTDGLVRRPGRTTAQGLVDLREAARDAAGARLEDLCDHVMDTAIDRKRRDDDASILGLRLSATSYGCDGPGGASSSSNATTST